MAQVRWAWSKGRRPSGAVLHSSREPVVRRPCGDLVDMLRRLINCRIIKFIIIDMYVIRERDVTEREVTSHDLSVGWSSVLCWYSRTMCHYYQGVLSVSARILSPRSYSLLTGYLLHCESKKLGHFYFYDNFGKCGPISVILSLMHSWINCRIAKIKSSTAPDFCCRTTL